MTQHLVLSIHLYDARFHGVPEWPPAPARAFQALLAGAAQGSSVPAGVEQALRWLEKQPAPVVAAPHAVAGQEFGNFVPNNDADSVDGDPGKIEGIRTQKLISPKLVDAEVPFVYAWSFEGSPDEVAAIELAAESLYQFGRGVDMAWAQTAVLDDGALQQLLGRYRGAVYEPSHGGEGSALACPTHGSVQSLLTRYRETVQRLRQEGTGRATRTLFVQPPKPRFAQVPYDSPAPRRVFELVHSESERRFPWRLRQVVPLVEHVRDAAVRRLCDALPQRAAEIHGAIVGAKPDEPGTVALTQRVRIIPLPSTGHEHADMAISRVLIEVPHDCPVDAEDVFWAFSGQSFDAATGEVASFTLVPADGDKMLPRYAARSRRFCSVTPLALPETAMRRRIEPARKHAESKPAQERIQEEQRARAAVLTALRHAGVRATVVGLHVQREPFKGKGGRAEVFAPGTRFEKERLWHVAIDFAERVPGVLTLGDGRFLGLGLLEPQEEQDGILAFAIESGVIADRPIDPVGAARALRRAVMARVQEQLGRERLPAFFSGHADSSDEATKPPPHLEVLGNGAAGAKPGSDEATKPPPHLAFHFDPRGALLIVGPNLVDRDDARAARRHHWALLEKAMKGFTELRAGEAGLFRLRSVPVSQELVCSSRCWESVTPYALCRHPKRQLPSDAIREEIIVSCRRLGLPVPAVEITQIEALPGRSVQGMARLTFEVAVNGPLILGRTRYLGGRLFTASNQ